MALSADNQLQREEIVTVEDIKNSFRLALLEPILDGAYDANNKKRYPYKDYGSPKGMQPGDIAGNYEAAQCLNTIDASIDCLEGTGYNYNTKEDIRSRMVFKFGEVNDFVIAKSLRDNLIELMDIITTKVAWVMPKKILPVNSKIATNHPFINHPNVRNRIGGSSEWQTGREDKIFKGYREDGSPDYDYVAHTEPAYLTPGFPFDYFTDDDKKKMRVKVVVQNIVSNIHPDPDNLSKVKAPNIITVYKLNLLLSDILTKFINETQCIIPPDPVDIHICHDLCHVDCHTNCHDDCHSWC